jgi:uncharacterized protein
MVSRPLVYTSVSLRILPLFMPKIKIINDPVYGFIHFPEPEVLSLIDHPWFQRLRYVKQMGLAHFVYPGAVHTRFHHSLGACHLMGKALDELKLKGISLDKEECLAARLAILYHDIGHGPFSHALEKTLVSGASHEAISQLIMQRINSETGGILTKAIEIFSHTYPRLYLHQLVSSQLDVDRMDYLMRDSFYTGVSEGTIGYDRILQMLTVQDNELLVEEKGIYSVENFILARRLMFWQVYLHKTVLGSEMLLINILNRAKELAQQGIQLFTTPALHHFLYQDVTLADFEQDPIHLDYYCMLDDHDLHTAIKMWRSSGDAVLSLLCKMLTERKLYKTVLSFESLADILVQKRRQIAELLPIDQKHLHYFVFDGVTSNYTYKSSEDEIKIWMKNNESRRITELENTLVNDALAKPVEKNYVCYIKI